MAVFKCKMCGGELNLIEGSNVCECEYCGTTQTVPSADDEKKMNLFNRANRLRFASEFDKAAGVFESILADFPEEAEAYWGLILCGFGIEYVDDPKTGKKIPTCHRSSFDSVMDDPNFEMVMEYSDPVSRAVYREEAKAIEELRKGIIEVSSKEEPYDIFICYKETDMMGERTIDSVIAQDVYTALTEKGYKVFFSRITLEDKLGQEYEPYIFAALNSAKVMLVFGTDYEYFNAVWVKNEWSRFLSLIEKGEKKTLIPCYKGIDAYDMPKEFARLQAQDMGKVGAIQDLLRGVEKIIPLKKEAESAEQAAQAAASLMVAPLLERAGIFLEDGHWNSVEEYCDKVLDIEPKNAKAYLYKTCAYYRKQNANDLISEDNFENYDSFKKAYRFADNSMKALLDEIVKKAKTHREEEERRKEIEEEAKKRKTKETREASIASNVSICSGKLFTGGLKADGTVVITGSDEYGEYGEYNVSGWTDVIAITCGDFHLAGLKSDGTVVAAGMIDCGQCNVTGWTDIIGLSAGWDHTVGLKPDGTVVAEYTSAKCFNCDQCNVTGWTDITAISCGDHHTAGLKSDGTVVATGNNDHGQCNVSGWTDVIALSAGTAQTAGLKSDGTVVAAGHDDLCNVTGWTDIIAIYCGESQTVGLKSDGTVVATGSNDEGECNVTGWTDIIAISCGAYHTAGLKSDGTVVATGSNEKSQCNVTGWTDIIAISCGVYYTVGLKSDGTIVVASDEEKSFSGKCDWKLFDNIDQLKEASEKYTGCIERIRKHAEEARREAEKRAEEARVEAEKRAEKARREEARLEKERSERRSQNVCQYCGGEFKGLLLKKCVKCGKAKDY